MTYNSEKAVSVCANGEKISGVLSVVSSFHRERVINNNALEKTPAEMIVTVKRVKFIGVPIDDNINLRGLDRFRFDIYTPHYISTYTDCIWLDFKEEIEGDNKIIETITLASLNYKMSTF